MERIPAPSDGAIANLNQRWTEAARKHGLTLKSAHGSLPSYSPVAEALTRARWWIKRGRPVAQLGAELRAWRDRARVSLSDRHLDSIVTALSWVQS